MPRRREMSEWWIDDQGRNNLSGVKGDPSNPPVLPDHLIVELLINFRPAKESFRRLLPRMLQAEQDRLNELVALNPRTLLDYPVDDQILGDESMRSLNTPGIRDPNRRRR